MKSSTNNQHNTNTGDGHVEASRTTGSSPPVWRDEHGRFRHSPERLAMAPPEADWRNVFYELAHGLPGRIAGGWRAEAAVLVAQIEAARSARFA
jgi:hypothetical protein